MDPQKIKIHVELAHDDYGENSQPAQVEKTVPAIETGAHWMRFVSRSAGVLSLIILIILIGIVGTTQRWKLVTPEFRSTLGRILVVLLLVIAYRWLDNVNDRFRIESDRVIEIYRKPLALGGQREKIALLAKVQTVEIIRANPFAYFFNYGDVIINVGESVLRFEYVPDPSQFQAKIFEQIASLQTSQQAQIDRDRQALIRELTEAIRNGIH